MFTTAGTELNGRALLEASGSSLAPPVSALRLVYHTTDQFRAVSGGVRRLSWPPFASAHPDADVRQRSPGLFLCRRHSLEESVGVAVLLPQWPGANLDGFGETPQIRQIAWPQPIWSLDVFRAEDFESRQRRPGAFAQTWPVRFFGTAHFSFVLLLWMRHSKN